MGQRTPIFSLHEAAGAKIVDFGGWDMPIHYGSQIEEHHAVRQDAGMCDVSHMTVVDVGGKGARDFLRYLVANDVDKLADAGKALYTPMLDEDGGILDDLIVYRLGEDYRLVVNCATRKKDLDWMERQAAAFDVVLTERDDLAIVAVQGPNSLDRVKAVMNDAADVIDGLKPFTAGWHGDWFLARTGYTGEKGLEVILPGTEAAPFWQALSAAGVRPVGLGARDTLRLEAGMNLYGSDMDESVTPAESNLDWTVAADDDRDFIGKSALARRTPEAEMVGLVLEGRGVIRAHYPVLADGEPVGEITSGAFSPTLSHSIGLARINRDASGPLTVEIRGKQLPVKRVKPPFVRGGKQVYKVIDE